MPFGAEVLEGGITRFRLWAPVLKAPRLRLDAGPKSRELPMIQAEQAGFFELVTDAAGPGSRYKFVVDDAMTVPDPAARAQFGGPHESSMVIDPVSYQWQDVSWQGRPWTETVIMEVHVGTFSEAGTFDGVRAELSRLADIGITAIQLMPIAAFVGERNWGYDGVLPYAPASSYGEPASLKALIDEAHRLGIQVFLDVVYNHFGPDGNYMHLTSPLFYRDDLQTPWGAALDFRQEMVRSYFVHNALYWLTEYRFDGLRLDAVHAISLDTRKRFLDELSYAVKARFSSRRKIHLILENEENDPALLEESFTAQWNDDIHHCLHVILTGETDGYYADYAQSPIDGLLKGLAEGFVYQGEPMTYRDGVGRGKPSAHLPPSKFIAFIQNHDQVGNRAMGDRLVTQVSAPAMRATHALLLLGPQIPMLFMGEEHAASQPFQFFTDFGGELGEAVRKGRRNEFKRFAQFADDASNAKIPDPEAVETMVASTLDTASRQSDEARDYQHFMTELLKCRRTQLMPLLEGEQSVTAQTRRLGNAGFEITWSFENGAQWSLLGQLAETEQQGYVRPAGDLVWATRLTDAGGLAKGDLAGWTLMAYLLPGRDLRAD
ncbi:MAG: malto-oligosyltrehalose trehalohydrolase [Burkholderiaceae bacterium]